jgi:predicted nuclease with RNAse H fold
LFTRIHPYTSHPKAGDFITHELSVAVHDQNVDVASAVRAAQAAAELRAEKAAATEKAAAMEGHGTWCFHGIEMGCTIW